VNLVCVSFQYRWKGTTRMTTPRPTLRQDLMQITAWSCVLPGLLMWPFLSLLPLGTLFGGTAGPVAITIQAVFFLTGFWTLLFGAIGFWALLTEEERARRAARRKPMGLMIGWFATAWVALFMFATLAGF
jgi:hypothetical protein